VLERNRVAGTQNAFFFSPPLKRQVTNGKGAMPAWGGQLSKEEIEGVAAYVYKTASESGW
jgi:mono/diheme cytochrome c family protein